MFHEKCLAVFMFLTICTVAGLNSHHMRASHVDADRSSGPHIAIILHVPRSVCGSVGRSIRRDCKQC